MRSGEDEPTPEQFRLAVRDVIANCIYGVDLNPLAVDLCKLALWLEGHWAGKPLSFLNHRIKCGNSLIGIPLPGQVEAAKRQVKEERQRLDERIEELRIESSRSAEAKKEWKKLIREREALAYVGWPDSIPDEAYQPVTGDDKATAAVLKKRNKEERSKGQLAFTLDDTAGDPLGQLADGFRQLTALREDTPSEVKQKAERYHQLYASETLANDRLAAHLWTSAFFWNLSEPRRREDSLESSSRSSRLRGSIPPTTATLRDFLADPAQIPRNLTGHAIALASQHRFFHWSLEFPEVFSHSGFDVLLGNPPWERIKLQEQEFFAGQDRDIANAPNKAARENLIKELPTRNPALAAAFEEAKHTAEAESKSARDSGRFPLTAVGDVNTYALFAELARRLLNTAGRAGIIVPTGIATDDTTKAFFDDLATQESLAQFIGFENEAFIFPAVHHAFKFCTLTMSGDQVKVERAEFIFFCRHFEDLQQAERRFQLSRDDFALLNPNTRTCPIFRTRADAELTKAIYRRVPVLVNEETGENPWGVRFMAMFHMANDSHLFQTEPGEGLLPLYEAKMMWQFDHRFGSYEGRAERGFTSLQEVSVEQLADPCWTPQPFYWVPRWGVFRRTSRVPSELIQCVESGDAMNANRLLGYLLAQYHHAMGNDETVRFILDKLSIDVSDTMEGNLMRRKNAEASLDNDDPAHLLTESDLAIIREHPDDLLTAARLIIENRCPRWFLGFRDVTNATNERTGIFGAIPRSAAGHTLPLALLDNPIQSLLTPCFLANMNGMPLDYVARQKIGGMHYSFGIFKQLPVLPPSAYTSSAVAFIVPRVLELVYTAWDIKAFADDLWRDADERLKSLLQEQWEANKAETGGHEWNPPDWLPSPVSDGGRVGDGGSGIPLPPFKWSDSRRALLRAELDAYYAQLYGLTRKQLRYILDPHGLSERELADLLDAWEDPTCSGPHLLPAAPALAFPGETFRVLKNKEEKAFGEYRTRRLVLEAWERLKLGGV